MPLSRLRRITSSALLAAFLATAPTPARAQITPLPWDQGAVGLGLALRHLPTSGGVLYITAHPDDENNGVLVMLNRGRGLDTALLTVTRGDGGQNEIGPELFQALGILRSEELAAIHRYDQAQQFFTRAYEFGYSFSVDETFAKWGREAILADVVRVIRDFRPDLILTLPLEAQGGGQHHQATAELAREAFRAAADPRRFPEQITEGLRPWQASKIYQGGTGGGPMAPVQDKGGVTVSSADYDPLLGMSWFQFGVLSRTLHKCQGAGQLTAPPAEGKTGYLLVDSEPKAAGTETDLLEGVPATLSGIARFAKGQEARAPFLTAELEAIEGLAGQARAAYDAAAPGKTLGPLAKGLAAVRTLVAKVEASPLSADAKYELRHRLRVKERDFGNAVALAQGVVLAATVDDGDVIRGQTFTVTARAFNQSRESFKLDAIRLRVPEGWTATRTAGEPGLLAYNGWAEWTFSVAVGPQARYSQPYWKRNLEVDRYDLEIPAQVTLPWSPPDVVARLEYEAAGVPASLEVPAYFRYEGRWVGGEKQKVVNVVPALSVALTPEIAVIPTGPGQPQREFRATVLNNAKGGSQVTVRLEAPAGWAVEPKQQVLSLRYEGEQVAARFFVTPATGLAAGEFGVKAVATAGGQEFREGYAVIAYDHIQERHLFQQAAARVKAIEVELAPGARVGYVKGAGDEVPEAIEQLGAQLEYLTPDDLAYGDLSKYDVVVTGIRAYQTRSDLKAYNGRLLEYAQGGGNVVVQYNKFEFNQLSQPSVPGGFGGGRPPDTDSPFAPYPARVTANRLTVEETPLQILVADHPLLTTPNRIGAADFSGWVQERGLYFLGAKDPRYLELLSGSDPWPQNPGEKKGMLTTAKVGKGSWTYVGLGLWRQLPAGTTGAYRILANLLSQPRGR